MLREEMQVPGLPGAEDVTDGSVDYYDMDWENVENGVTEEQMAKCIAKECACTPRCKCSGNLPDQSDEEAYEMTLEGYKYEKPALPGGAGFSLFSNRAPAAPAQGGRRLET